MSECCCFGKVVTKIVVDMHVRVSGEKEKTLLMKILLRMVELDGRELIALVVVSVKLTGL
jgi:hypothetical protein